MMGTGEAYYAAAEKRIEYLTIGAGSSAAIIVLIFWGAKPGASLAAGAAMSWLNFRWMKQGVGVFVSLARAQAGVEIVRIPKSVYLKFLGRYALLLVTAYVILSRIQLPAGFLIAGLFAVVAGALLEMIFELFTAGKEARTGES